jgi:chromosome segregation ATPase
MHAKETTAREIADQTTPSTLANATQTPVANPRKGAKRAEGGARSANRNPRTATPNREIPRSSADTFADERDDVLTVINELEDQLDRYEEIRETLERELTEVNEQNQAAKQRVQELEWQAVTLQTRVEALEQMRQEVGLLEEEIADANARGQRLAEQLSQAEKENARVNGELKTANKQLEEFWAVRKERDGLRVDIKNAYAKLDQLERAHKEALDERSAILAKLQEAQLALEETRSGKNQSELDLRTAEDRNEELRRSLEDMQQKLETIRGEKRNVQAQLTHMERENGRLIEQQQFYECELTSLRSMNRNAESALANVKKAFSEVRVALAETKARARRRALETWPRTCGALRGVSETRESQVDQENIEAIAATTPGDVTDDSPEPVTSDPNEG